VTSAALDRRPGREGGERVKWRCSRGGGRRRLLLAGCLRPPVGGVLWKGRSCGGICLLPQQRVRRGGLGGRVGGARVKELGDVTAFQVGGRIPPRGGIPRDVF